MKGRAAAMKRMRELAGFGAVENEFSKMHRKVTVPTPAEQLLLNYVYDFGCGMIVFLSNRQAEYTKLRLREILKQKEVGEEVCVGIRDRALVTWAKGLFGTKRLTEGVIEALEEGKNIIRIGTQFDPTAIRERLTNLAGDSIAKPPVNLDNLKYSSVSDDDMPEGFLGDQTLWNTFTPEMKQHARKVLEEKMKGEQK
jgi:hypothetical protein